MYRLSHRARLALTSAFAIVPLHPVAAAPKQAAPATKASIHDDDPNEDIVVNGRALPGAVIGDIPPENRLTPADIASYGVGTINDLLTQITEMTESDQGRDSSAAPIILVNGKRVSGVNEVGDLPTESVLRIDILPEEVALKYGYDAQQKVVNVILRRHFYSRVANLSGGASTAGVGENGSGDFTYTRIHDNDRVNIVGRVSMDAAIMESDRGVSSTIGTISDPTGQIGNDSRYRTLEPSSNTYTVNAVVAHQLSKKVTASFNLRASYETSNALDGLASGKLIVPAGSPYALSDGDGTIDRYLSNTPLHKDVDDATAHAGATLNVDLPKKWQLSVIGAYDHSDVRTETDHGYDLKALQDDIDSDTPGVDPYGVLPASALGALERQHAVAVTDTGSTSALIHGSLFRLPAGDVGTSLRIGGNFSRLSSSVSGFDDSPARNLSRTSGNAQLSFDFPLTSRSKHVFGAIGDLSVNVNGSVNEISNFGALGAFGYGLHWTPRKGVSLIASVNEDRIAPTLAELNDPIVATSNVRVYDYVRDQTVTVSQIAGGNPNLKADDRHVFKLELSLDAVETRKTKLNFTVDYIHGVTHNAIGTISSATEEAEEAFPDRFQRDADGALESIDARAVNFDREDRSEVRWGINFTKVLRAPKRPRPPPGFRRRWRQDSSPPPEEAPPPDGDLGGNTDDSRSPLVAPGASGAPEGRDANGAIPGSNDQDIVVRGQRNTGDAFGPPAPDGGRGWRNGGWGRRNGGFGGGRRDGQGGRHGSPGGFYAGNGAQFQFSLYHSWYFRDDVRLARGGPTVDLLNGGTIGSDGQARHKIQFNAGLFDNGIGTRLSGNWMSATKVDEDRGNIDPLYYSSLATFDLRLFADLQQRLKGKAWARGARLTLSLSNILNAHQHVHDATGMTPLIYQPAFLDPYGRTVRITFRKVF